MNKLLLSCKKATGLIEKRTYHGLRLHEHIQLFFHKQLCDACRNYEKQSLVLHQLLIKNFNEESDKTKINNDEFKKDIKNKIDEL